MTMTRDRVNTIGWGAALAVCFALTMGLTFRVNAVKSEVRLADRQIASLRQENMLLETEFETRASQQQLQALNAVDFGYQSPKAGQYMENERDLAALGKPRSPDAPQPIRVAAADSGDEVRAMPAVVEPIAREFAHHSDAPAAHPHKVARSTDLDARLTRVARAGANE